MYAKLLKVPSFSEKKRPLPRKFRVKVACLLQISVLLGQFRDFQASYLK